MEKDGKARENIESVDAPLSHSPLFALCSQTFFKIQFLGSSSSELYIVKYECNLNRNCNSHRRSVFLCASCIEWHGWWEVKIIFCLLKGRSHERTQNSSVCPNPSTKETPLCVRARVAHDTFHYGRLLSNFIANLSPRFFRLQNNDFMNLLIPFCPTTNFHVGTNHRTSKEGKVTIITGVSQDTTWIINSLISSEYSFSVCGAFYQNQYERNDTIKVGQPGILGCFEYLASAFCLLCCFMMSFINNGSE